MTAQFSGRGRVRVLEETNTVAGAKVSALSIIQPAGVETVPEASEVCDWIRRVSVAQVVAPGYFTLAVLSLDPSDP